MALPIGAIIGGVTQIAGSLIGGKARRKEAREAAAQKAADLDRFRNFQFTNPYESMENVFEDATINQQATQFQAQQTDQALAQALQTATMAGGASGGAQAIAEAALKAKQGISADIASQEQALQSRSLEQEAALQSASGAAVIDIEQQKYAGAATNLQLSAARDATARQARQQATQGLLSGIGSFAGGVGGALAAMKQGGGKGFKGFMNAAIGNT
jgi:hypothetical protein